MWWQNKRAYLDFAAATPVRKEVLEAMKPYWSEDFGNASAIHQEGYKAKQALAAARENVARTLRVRQNDIIFTSGGTESNNLALRGTMNALQNEGMGLGEIEIITLTTEHPSVLKTVEALELEGVGVRYLSVGEDGLANIEEFKTLLSPRTRLVSVAYANSETGVVQDLTLIGRIIREFEKKHGISIAFHTDASQAPLWLPCALDALFVDMMTLDAGKCMGPKGIGVLVKRPKASLAAATMGGPQESDLRPGTEPLPLIVGATTAIVLAQKEAEENHKRVLKLRDAFIKKLLKLPHVVLNGSKDHRLPNNVNISIPGIDTEFAVVTLDQKGVAASTKSACGGAGSGRSIVVMNMTGDEARSAATIRFTLGPSTTWGELKKTINILKDHIKEMGRFSFDS